MVAFSGAFPHDLLDLNDWRWQGPVKENGVPGEEGDGKAVSVPSDEADTSKIETYRDDPWFVLVTGGDGSPYVRLRSPAKGSTTSSGSSATTRSELREMHHPDDDRKSAWNANGSTVHNLKVRLAVTKVMEKGGKRSRVAVAQVHKTTEDGILVYLDGESGRLRWKQDSQVQSGSLGDHTLGQYVNIGLSVRDGKCRIFVDDVQKAEGKLTGDAASTCYFKTGCYNQDNERDDGYPAKSFNEVRIAAVKVQHGVPWAPGGYDPIGPGVGSSGQQGGNGNPSEPQPRPQVTGSKPRDLITFIGREQAWNLNLDVDKHDEHSGVGDKARNGRSDEKSAKTLAGGFVHKDHFDVVENGTAVRFRSHLNGATTKGSNNPRTELREMQPGDPSEEPERAGWEIGTGNRTIRRLTARVKVTHAPQTPGHNRVSIGQIHGGRDDLLQIMYDGKEEVVGYSWAEGDAEGEWQDDDPLITDYPAGSRWFTYQIEVRRNTVRILVDDGQGLRQKVVKTGGPAEGCYFKAGAYTQSHVGRRGADPDDFGEALFRSIVVDTEDED